MSNYFSNLARWLAGFTKLGMIAYKPGWGPWKFFPIYLLDYGANVLTGGSIESVSRALYDTGKMPAWFAYHGSHAGPPLWDTVPCDWQLRVPLIVVVLVLLWVLL